jgi:hypothetical protein
MKTLRLVVNGCFMVGVTAAALSSIGCATHERVVVRERPAVVQERVVVTERPVVQERVVVTQPVVQERVIVRP